MSSASALGSGRGSGAIPVAEAAKLVGKKVKVRVERVLGRVAAGDIRDPFTGEIIVQASTEINEELSQKIEDSGLEIAAVEAVHREVAAVEFLQLPTTMSQFGRSARRRAA